jgi:hypothetical protein
MTSAAALPPPKALQAALRKTTERLANELAQPTDSAPQWSDFEWRIARAVAAMHGVSPLLSRVLRWQGPAEWNEFLVQQKTQTAARHARIEELLRLIDKRAIAEGICVVALKGAELHAMGLYVAGERPMADVDLLVRTGDKERTTQMLGSLGFQESFSVWKHSVLAPGNHAAPCSLGEHADNYLKIELHDRIREALPLDTAEVSECIFPTQPRPGLNPYPSRAALMIHLLLHAAGAIADRSLRLLHLHDLALLSSHMTDRDWDDVLRQSATDRGHRWALPPLHLTARYFGRAVPTRVLTALTAGCPRLLRAILPRRTLSDVSLSRLRIEAFPGIELSRSASEMARYVVSRVRPSGDSLATRNHLARTQVAATASQWHHMSQGQRVLRWVISRPPRAYTMLAVRMALGHAQP